MAKKAAVKKIRPSLALASLTEYHEKVFMLVQTASLVKDNLNNSQILPALKPDLEHAIKEVKAFYTDEE